MQSAPLKRSKTNVAVVGVGYWGKNLVRNFYDLGVLSCALRCGGIGRNELQNAVSRRQVLP